MIWHVFENDNTYNTDPRTPGKYLGSIDIPEKWENGIDTNLQKFDLHLRKTRRKAYGDGYKHCWLHFTMSKYTGFSL